MKKLLLVSLVLVALGGVAQAAIPSSDGLITGCYFNGGGGQVSGSLRVIDAEAGQVCSGNETALTWGQVGPIGPQGPAGTFPSTYSNNASFIVPASEADRDFTILCGTGDKATGGGYRLTTSLTSVRVTATHQTLALDGWTVTMINGAGSQADVEIFVVCQDLA